MKIPALLLLLITASCVGTRDHEHLEKEEQQQMHRESQERKLDPEEKDVLYRQTRE